MRGLISRLFGKREPEKLGSHRQPVYLPLPTEEKGELGGALILHPASNRHELLKAPGEMIREGSKDLGLLFGHAVATFPALTTYLQAGNLVQIVGKPEHIAGLAKGTYKLTEKGGAFLGTIREASSGRIAGQLRFQHLSKLKVVGPLLLWQAANIVLGTIHLQRIDEKLAKLQDAIADLEKTLHFTRLASAIVASEILEEVAEKYRTIGYFTDDMVFRLATAEREIRTAYKESELKLGDFEKLASETFQKKGKQGAENAVSLLETKADKVSGEVGFMTDIFKAEVKAYQLGMLHEMQTCPENLENSMNKVRAKTQDHRNQMEKVRVFRELAEHANACVAEMNWFHRKVLDRGVVQRVQQQTGKPWEQLLVAQGIETAGEVYVVWQENNSVWTKRLERPEE